MLDWNREMGLVPESDVRCGEDYWTVQVVNSKDVALVSDGVGDAVRDER
jgi:hypothetical protein